MTFAVLVLAVAVLVQGGALWYLGHAVVELNKNLKSVEGLTIEISRQMERRRT